MAKRCLKVRRKSKFEARNLPTWGCKSMMEGPTIMLGVFIVYHPVIHVGNAKQAL